MKIEYNKVTWYSKLTSFLLLLGVLPIFIFFIGREYQKTVSSYDKETDAAVKNVSNGTRKFSSRETRIVDATYNSGVKGVAMVGPTCPVSQQGSEVECSDKPISTPIKFINQFGAATTTTSAEDGSYKIMLPPGNYTIMSGADGIYPALDPVRVTIENGVYETIDLTFDSGIR